MAGLLRAQKAEIPLYHTLGDLVKQNFKKNYTRSDPEICEISTIAFLKKFCYNLYIR